MNIKKEYGGRTLTFGPLTFGYMKKNRDLLNAVGVKATIGDLIDQMDVARESLRNGMGDDAPDEDFLDELKMSDLSDLLLTTLEASGFVFNRLPVGEESPAKA